jgi:hypothetical protein
MKVQEVYNILESYGLTVEDSDDPEFADFLFLDNGRVVVTPQRITADISVSLVCDCRSQHRECVEAIGKLQHDILAIKRKFGGGE